MINGKRGVIYFDGVCGLCNRYIDFILKRKNAHRFLFAPLQGNTAREELPLSLRKVDTVIYKKADQIYIESSAALHILKDLGQIWVLFYLFLLIPPLIRNAAYRWIAKHRFRWFGKKESCRIPSKEEQDYFLP